MRAHKAGYGCRIGAVETKTVLAGKTWVKLVRDEGNHSREILFHRVSPTRWVRVGSYQP